MDTKKLRQKILDLAIHGKLVPQDPNDEPASVLLERIKAEKEQLIKEGKIKRQKKSASSDTSHYWNDVPFEVPKGWVWISGKDLFLPMRSTSPSGEKFSYIDIDAIDNKKNIAYPKIILTESAPSRASRYTQYGDTLFSMVRPYLKNIAKVPTEHCIASTGFYICHPYSDINADFIFYMMISDYVVDGLNSFIKGDNSPSISSRDIDEWKFPLPPVVEQQRIVDEIEKYFSIINTIENEEVALKDSVKKAKSKVLELALSGRLTSDTSHYGKWPYLPLSEIFNITMGQSPDGYYINQNNDGIEFHQGKLHFGQRHLLNSRVFTSNVTKVADAYSLLMCVRAPVGVLNITNRKVCIGRGLCALKPKDSNMPIEYWYYALSSLSNYFEENSTGSTFKAITMDVIKTTYVHVPPVNEQKLIARQVEHIYQVINNILKT